MHRAQRTTSLRTWGVICAFAAPGYLALGNTGNWTPVVQNAASHMTARLDPPVPDPDEEYWDQLDEFIRMICKILRCDKFAPPAQASHAEIIELLEDRIDSYNTSGLLDNLTANDVAEGLEIVTETLGVLGDFPGVLPTQLEADLEQALVEMEADLLTYSRSTARGGR